MNEEAQDVFKIGLDRYMDRNVVIEQDAVIDTIVEPVTVDYLCTFGPTKIAFRLDLALRGDPENLQEWQVAAMLGSGIDIVYYLKARNIQLFLDDCLFVVARFNPELFSQQGLVNLYKNASKTVKEYDFSDKDDNYETIGVTYYHILNEDEEPESIFVMRYDKRNLKDSHVGYLLLFIEHLGDKDFSTLIAKRRVLEAEKNKVTIKRMLEEAGEIG